MANYEQDSKIGQYPSSGTVTTSCYWPNEAEAKKIQERWDEEERAKEMATQIADATPCGSCTMTSDLGSEDSPKQEEITTVPASRGITVRTSITSISQDPQAFQDSQEVSNLDPSVPEKTSIFSRLSMQSKDKRAKGK